ncbi:uncharacterized protein PAC_02000 [Phialocephala subalpina]|uniref:DUF7924 domain-containing protein n=1 Tax=Phialocephala subalpina TaxID=576137 RepID=A0A1L7WH80_9HELO|nr:uncharacterized protein PAC_02000 [Phialocephala subalpina]
MLVAYFDSCLTGTRPQGIKKERPQPPSRRSARLQSRQERTVSKNTNTEPKLPLSSLTSNTPGKKSPQAGERKRKRTQEPEGPSSLTLSEPLRKQRRTSLADAATKDTYNQRATSGINDNKTNSIGCNTPGKKSPQAGERKRKRTQEPEGPSSLTLSEPLRKQRRTSLADAATKDTYNQRATSGINDNKTNSIGSTQPSLRPRTVPQDSLFRDDVFDKACRKIQDRNEARVVQDITRLIVPSAETLATYGATHLDPLIESVNEGWNSAEPFYGPRPQPDYSVGFGRSAFMDDQLEKLQPFVGEVPDTFTSYFMATWQMYLPFLTCEVKCGAAALDVADRQNAHSMTLAVRGVVELFRLVERENELHREILAFSISHDHRMVRIYGHYPIIDGKKATFYRHPIHEFSFTALDGKEKWTAYKFTKNVYDIWMPSHLKKICSVIDALPNFEVSQQSEPGESGLSQVLGSYNLSELSNQDALCLLEEANSQSSHVGDVTPETSVSQRIEGGAFKKPKRGRPELH